MMRRIMQIKKNLLSALVDEACKISIIPILHIIGKPNSIIVFLSIQNIPKFLTNIPPPRLSLKLWPISWHSFLILTVACYCQIFLKKDNMHQAICFGYSYISSELFSFVRNSAILNCRFTTFFSSLLPKQPHFQTNIHWSTSFPSKYTIKLMSYGSIFQIWSRPAFSLSGGNQ